MALRTGTSANLVAMRSWVRILWTEKVRTRRIHSSSELPGPTSYSWWKLTGTITAKCGVHMRPVGAGSRRQTAESHHLGLQMRLQLLLCFRSLSCRVDRAWTTAYPLVYQSGCTLISTARESESEGTAQRSGVRRNPIVHASSFLTKQLGL